MAQITLNVPDNKFSFYKQVFKEFKEVFIEETNEDEYIDSIFTEGVVKMLDERSNAPLEESLTLEEVKVRIRSKYTQYGL